LGLLNSLRLNGDLLRLDNNRDELIGGDWLFSSPVHGVSILLLDVSKSIRYAIDGVRSIKGEELFVEVQVLA